MAKQQAAEVPQISGHDADLKSEAQLVQDVADSLRHYHPENRDRQPDLLDGRYRIDVNAPLPELDSPRARAFAVSDMINSGRTLFALVCAPGTMQRHKAIQQLKGVNHPNIMPLVTAGATLLSKPAEERFVLIYHRPAGKRLSEVLTEAGRLDETFLIRNVIAPIANALMQLAEMDLPHGFVNPRNIFFGDKPMLGDCVSEPCGYSQPFHYESLERMQAMPAGKGDGTPAQDYYALAMLVLEALHGAGHFSTHTPQSLARQILKEGLEASLIGTREVPDIFTDFFRGLLTMQAKDRWSEINLRAWIDGRRYTLPIATKLVEAIRPFVFESDQANSRRELAQLFHMGWSKIPALMQHHHLNHWISVSMRNKELADTVDRVVRNVTEMGARNEVQLNEQLMHLLLYFDPLAPIRIDTLSFHVDGMNALLLDLILSKSEKNLQHLAKFIEFNMVGFWVELQREDAEYVMPASINAIVVKLERLRVSIRNTGYGFGLERVLYDLCPELPCLSPLFSGRHISQIPALLARLDEIALSAPKDQDPMDRHIAAFIASKLSIQHDIKLHDLEAIPSLASNRAILALRLIALAEERWGNTPLPGLAHWLGLRILPSLDAIHSRALRGTIKALLVEHVKVGDIQAMSKLVIDSGYAALDRKGYQAAHSTYHHNVATVVSLKKGEFLDQKSSALGFAISKTVAYLGFFGVLFSVMGNI